MMEQKPVAWVTYSTSEWFGKANGVGVFQYEKRDDCKIPLFTADQLKAEREKAIRECAEIASKWESYDFDTHDICTPSVKILELLSTNESKDNEVKG